jgi:Antibiotic biosynthesis monooxygenase
MDPSPAFPVDPFPDITRPDAAQVLVRSWTLRDDAEQRALAEALADRGAPSSEGPIARTLLLGTDEPHVLTYTQWARQARIPAAEHRTSIAYELYRSSGRPNPPRPGCIVIVSVRFEGPDPERQRRWIDTVFDALGSETELHPGGISGHFHVSIDGTRVLNYAEWTSAAAHREALGPGGTVGRSTAWQRVHSFPGVVESSVARYRPFLR